MDFTHIQWVNCARNVAYSVWLPYICWITLNSKLFILNISEDYIHMVVMPNILDLIWVII